MRVARPTESGSAPVLTPPPSCPRSAPPADTEASATGATVNTARTAPQARRRAVSGWIGPTPRSSADGASAPGGAPGPLPVHVAVRTGAQLGGGKLNQRVGAALRRRPPFPGTQAVAERIDRGLHQRPALGIELTAQDVHVGIGLLALEPAALVGVVVVRKHAVGIEAQPGGLDQDAHRPGLEGLRGTHQDALEGRHLRHADLLGEMGDHRHVGERGTPGPGAVQRGRQLAQRPRQVHPVGGRLHGHAAARAQPGHRAHPALGGGSMPTIKAVQAADELRLEAIDGPADLDQVGAERVGRDPVDGLVDERIDGRTHTVARLRYRDRLHTP